MEEGKEEENLIASLRYFEVGDPECAVCEKRAKVARLTTTMNRKMLITMMCEKCATSEMDGLLERKDMVMSRDGSHLVSHALAAISDKALQRAIDEQHAAFEARKGEAEGGNVVSPDIAAAINDAVQKAMARRDKAEKVAT